MNIFPGILQTVDKKINQLPIKNSQEINLLCGLNP